MKRGMDAVYSKSEQGMSSKRTPMLKRKPKLSVMIAVEKPKMGPPRTSVMGKREAEMDHEGMDEGDEQPEESKDSTDPAILLAKIRQLTKRVEYLESCMAEEEDPNEQEGDEDADD